MSDLALMTKPDWARLSREWEGSGVCQRTFCEERGVSYYKFRAERGKLKERGLQAVSCRKSLPGASLDRPKSSNALMDFLPVEVEVEQAPYESLSNVGSLRSGSIPPEIELKLPFGVVLRFRGVQQQ